MKLVASMITRNEMGRYLRPAIESLAAFCDEIRVLDDASDDGSCEWLCEHPAVELLANEGAPMFEHEGRARQALLEWTLKGTPTHVLAIDADEFVADGQKLRAAIGDFPSVGVYALTMLEVWKAGESALWTREDGGWKAHPVPILWAVPPGDPRRLRIRDRALACGREPEQIGRIGARGIQFAGTDILHFGWAREAERAARYERYVVADGGRFHASAHLKSIMWEDGHPNLRLEERSWPVGLREALR